MTSYRRTAQRTTLAEDGAKARELFDQGFTVREVLELIGGSRTRLYRALDAANAVPDASD